MLNRLVLYARDVEETVRFYETHFEFEASRSTGDRIVEMTGRKGGATLMVHPAGKGQRAGQSAVKLVFDVADVVAFCADRARNGLVFGTVHQADGYVFANAHDPSKNPISVSSRAVRSAS